MRKGFSLIETIVAIFVFGMLMGLIVSFTLMFYKTQSFTYYQAIAIDEARRGIETMVKEIREIKSGDNGSYPIESAGDKEFVFYSDIDKDSDTERVRYFLGGTNSGSETKECQTSVAGGSCSVTFSNFLTGTLVSAQVKISVEGDFGWANHEYAELFADSIKLSNICMSGCSDCPGAWQGTLTFDVTGSASDNAIVFMADASNEVGPGCPHAMKARFEFNWVEDLSTLSNQFKRGVTDPSNPPITYPSANEKVEILSSYVRNTPPIFQYYDANGNQILDYPAHLNEVKLMRLYLIINVDPGRPPDDFHLESFVQLRNLKEE